MIVGIGVDLCEVDRMEAAIARHGERFLARIYTDAERAYCESKPNRMERFAGRFAAKEAAMKAIGTGWRRGVGWRDFEVTRAASGQPVIRLPRRSPQNCRRAWSDTSAGFHHAHQEPGHGASGAGGASEAPIAPMSRRNYRQVCYDSCQLRLEKPCLVKSNFAGLSFG